MSVNDKLTDIQIRHAIHLLRFGNGLEREILALLETVNRDVLAKIAARLATIEERGFDLGTKTTQRLNGLLDEIRQVSEGVYDKTREELEARLGDLAGNETDFQAKALATALPIEFVAKLPSPTLLRAIVTERPIQGALLRSFIQGAAKGHVDRIEGAIRIGMTEGQTIDEMVRRIRGTRAANYQDGIMEVSRRSARAIVRTSVNHVSNHAAQETWRANERVVKGWQFVATLDSRTTIICASLDGKVFPIGEGPIPPRHPNCRSITVAVTKSFNEMGLDREDYSPETRASVDGQVAAPQTFATWLKKQSPERQETILGKKRADLWRAGKFKLEDFVRDNSEVITLDELRKLHPASFD